jgi:type VI secretion system protein ImpA
MTPDEIAALSSPLSGDEPCGPDLEMLGDADYMRFTARVDGLLPRSFAAFDRGSIQFADEFATLKELLSRSRDLRLLTPLAKLEILNRDVAAYAAVFKLIETLMESAWPTVVPALIDGDAVLRIVTLQTLDDMADSVMPLQAAPLFEARRFGKFTYRSHLLASGKVQPREGENAEEVPSASAVGSALNDVDINQLVAARDLLVGLQTSVGRIETLVNQQSGQDGALRFDRLGPLVKEMAGFLDQTVAARDPALAVAGVAPVQAAAGEAQPDDAPAGSVSTISSAAQAQAALAAAAAYFTQSEPSSPILLLIGQAQALVGRSFYEAMQVLLPARSAEARIRIGQDPAFVLQLERLAGLPVTMAEEGATNTPDDAPSDSSESETSEAQIDSNETSGEIPETDAAPEAGPASTPAPAPVVVPADPAFRAPDRRSAMALLQQVAAHYRRAEPSSPIAVLLERADAIAGKDFIALLREAFPAGALKIEEQSSDG